MAQHMQDRILGAIEEVITRADYEPVIHRKSPTSGTLYAQFGLHTRLAMNFGFGAGSCSFELWGSALHLHPGRKQFKDIGYAEGHGFVALLDRVAELLAPEQDEKGEDT